MSYSYQYDQTSPVQPNSYAPNDYSQQPLLPVSSQPNPQESKLRWRILLLACLSTFGASFTQTFLNISLPAIIQTLHMTIKAYGDALSQIEGYACLAPLLAGIMIYHFGVNSTYRIFVFLLALGRIFTTTSLRSPSWNLFIVGESCFHTASLGLIVTQLYMVLKWFKGFEISLAIGTIGWSNLLAERLAIYLSSYMNSIGFGNIMLLGSVLCLMAAIGVVTMNKIDIKVKREDERDEGKPFFEELSLIKPVTWVLVLGVVCFSVGEYSASGIYIFDLINRHGATDSMITAINYLSIYIPAVMYPLFGLLADKKGKRIATMFISVMMFFIGNTAFFLFRQSTYIVFIYLAFLLFALGSCLFQVSSWACIGIATPLRVLGLVLGLAYSLISFANWSEEYIYAYKNLTVNAVCYAATFALIAGIVLSIFTWKLDRQDGGKIESNDAEYDGVRRAGVNRVN